jgi:hypothetical protein
MMRLFNLSGPRTGQKLRQRAFYWIGVGVMAGVALWAILSIVALAVNCSVPGFIQGDGASCSHQVCGSVQLFHAAFLTTTVSSLATDHRLRRCDRSAPGPDCDLCCVACTPGVLHEVSGSPGLLIPSRVSANTSLRGLC